MNPVTLYNLMREYEERRQALVDQLQRNPDLDPAVQHQIYGAIKEIEHFLRTIEQHAAAGQEQASIDLAHDRPRPFVERTKRLASKVKEGTRAVFKERIPGVARKITNGPRNYFERRRERKRLRKQIEHELLARMQHTAASAGDLPGAVHEEQRQEPVLPAMSVGGELEAQYSSTKGTPRDDLDEPRDMMPKRRRKPKKVKKAKRR